MSPSRARLRALLAITSRVADARDPLGREARADLARRSGLSREGVELALGRCLETRASDAELARLEAEVTRAPRCHVVLSASVCTAAARALALALATSTSIRVRPSRRAPGLAPLLARELSAALPELDLAIVEDVAARAGDEVHAYGSDATLDALRASLPAGVVLRGHGHGFGLIVTPAADDLDALAAAVVEDVIAFDQRGCLSPRALCAIGDAAAAAALGARVAERLALRAREVPAGALDPAERAELARFATIAAATGELFGKGDHLVAVQAEGDALLLAPPLRCLTIAPCRDATAAAQLIAPLARWVTTVGAPAELFDALHLARARRAAVGSMQAPPLDGPVDRRTFPLTL